MKLFFFLIQRKHCHLTKTQPSKDIISHLLATHIRKTGIGLGNCFCLCFLLLHRVNLFLTFKSLLNDCHSILNLINNEQKIASSLSSLHQISNNPESSQINLKTTETDPNPNQNKSSHSEYESIIVQLENDKLELIAKLNELQQNRHITVNESNQSKITTIDALTPAPIEITSTVSTVSEKDETEFDSNNEATKLKLEKTIESLNEKILHLNANLNEMTNLYEMTKQSELDEKTKNKHTERSLRAIKIEKDQLFAQIVDLQERANLQAKDLQEAQTQRKLAVQEFTDVNDKVKELRSKNAKISNDLLNKEDEIEELKRLCATHKFELEKRDKTIDDFKIQIVNFKENLNKLEAERQEFLQQNLILKTNESSTDDIHVEEASKSVENKEMLEMQQQLQAQISELESRNLSFLNELEETKQKHLEACGKLYEEFSQTIELKENEIKLAQTEIARLNTEIEQLNCTVEKLQQEKKTLEDEVHLFNESKQAMSKYDWQMNEILQMVNEEKVVRGHLRSLASKLIEEVDSLRSQTAAAASTGSGSILVSNGNNNLNSNNNNMLINGVNGGANGWKNRCSEKRDRINVQNMQIALEKEFEAKGQLLEENNNLKSEMESRAHKISDLQSNIGIGTFIILRKFDWINIFMTYFGHLLLILGHFYRSYVV